MPTNLKGAALIYCKSETRTRLRALANIDGRTLIEYLDRLARQEVSKIDRGRYRTAVERVTSK